jgi:protein archease
MKTYEPIDHTADLGLWIYGSDSRDLFRHAGEAFTDLISETKKIRPTERRDIEVRGDSLEEMLVRFLKELLYLFETENLLFSKFTIKHLDDNLIQVEAHGEALDLAKHPFKTGIKAVTYHQLRIEEWKGGLRATVIFDV